MGWGLMWISCHKGSVALGNRITVTIWNIWCRYESTLPTSPLERPQCGSVPESSPWKIIGAEPTPRGQEARASSPKGLLQKEPGDFHPCAYIHRF